MSDQMEFKFEEATTPTEVILAKDMARQIERIGKLLGALKRIEGTVSSARKANTTISNQLALSLIEIEVRTTLAVDSLAQR